MKSRLLLLTLAFLWTTLPATAQQVYTSSGKPAGKTRNTVADSKKGFNPDRMIYGGGFGIGYSGGGYDGYTGQNYSSSFNIGISPVVGYRITDNFMAGVGLGYQYFSAKDYWRDLNGKTYPLRQHLFSPSVWARYGFLEQFFVQAEGEYNRVSYNHLKFDASGNTINTRAGYSAPAILLGGGLRQRISERSSFLIAVMYDVLQDQYSPYGKKIIFRTGISIGY